MTLRILLWIALAVATAWVLASFVLGARGPLVRTLLIAAFILASMWLVWRMARRM